MSVGGSLKPIAVLGSNGQVGKALLSLLGDRGIGLSHSQADLTQIPKTLEFLNTLRPAALINAAAYTQVDRAETERDLARKINGEAPGALAAWAKSRGIPFVHYSTDYVFSGEGSAPWKETDAPSPVNFYGETKLEGETSVAAQGQDYLIFRTSWVYDAHGKNFLNTMLRLGAEKDSLNVVNDQIGAPTFALDIAATTIKALEQSLKQASFPSGVYHLVNSGEISWHGFATRIFELAQGMGQSFKLRELKAIPSSEYPLPAPRPKNSRLSTDKLRNIFGIELRPWDDALAECMQDRYRPAK
jgi:dTDP-4-dehydrorhamnose reductase